MNKVRTKTFETHFCGRLIQKKMNSSWKREGRQTIRQIESRNALFFSRRRIKIRIRRGRFSCNESIPLNFFGVRSAIARGWKGLKRNQEPECKAERDWLGSLIVSLAYHLQADRPLFPFPLDCGSSLMEIAPSLVYLSPLYSILLSLLDLSIWSRCIWTRLALVTLCYAHIRKRW